MIAAKLIPDGHLEKLESVLLHRFNNPEIGICALIHKSFANEHRDEQCPDNERLEFLGDAVLDLGISLRLMERFPVADEGVLSKFRALIVNEGRLAAIARERDLGKLLLLGRGEELTSGREKDSVLADALEAIIGALYLEAGMERVLAFIDLSFKGSLENVEDRKHGDDFKTVLQELCQERFHLAPRYNVIAETGPEHGKQFEVEVTINASMYGKATGRSKKEAEQAAAGETLKQLKGEIE